MKKIKKRFINKRVLCALLAAAAVSGAIGFTGNTFDPVQAETIEELQKQQEELKKQQEELKQMKLKKLL